MSKKWKIVGAEFEALLDRALGRIFDWRYRVKTEGWVEPYQLDAPFVSLRFAKRYQPTHMSVLKRVFELITIDRADFHFYDFGHGKGRVLIEACNQGFAHCFGFEFSPQLFSLSIQNIEKYCHHFSKKITSFSLINDDACNLSISTQKNIYFFYNPFEGPIMRKVLERIVSQSTSLEHDQFVFVNLQQDFLLELLGFELFANSDHPNYNRKIKIYKFKRLQHQ